MSYVTATGDECMLQQHLMQSVNWVVTLTCRPFVVTVVILSI